MPAISHTQPSQVSQEGTVSGSTWRHPLRSQGCYYEWLFSSSSAAKPLFPFRITPPSKAGTARQVGTGGGQAQGPAGLRATNLRVFVSSHHLFLALGVCQEGKGQGWGPNNFSGTGHTLTSSGGQGGAHSVSHEASVSPLPGQHPEPHIWVWGGDSGWQITPLQVTLFTLSDLLLLWRMRTRGLEEVIPKPLAQESGNQQSL